jgi:hypothetical protein
MRTRTRHIKRKTTCGGFLVGSPLPEAPFDELFGAVLGRIHKNLSFLVTVRVLRGRP